MRDPVAQTDDSPTRRMRADAVMKIVDYETGKELSDVGLFLDAEEVEELIATLSRLVSQPSVSRIHLSTVAGSSIDRELTISLNDETPGVAKTA